MSKLSALKVLSRVQPIPQADCPANCIAQRKIHCIFRLFSQFRISSAVGIILDTKGISKSFTYRAKTHILHSQRMRPEKQMLLPVHNPRQREPNPGNL